MERPNRHRPNAFSLHRREIILYLTFCVGAQGRYFVYIYVEGRYAGNCMLECGRFGGGWLMVYLAYGMDRERRSFSLKAIQRTSVT